MSPIVIIGRFLKQNTCMIFALTAFQNLYVSFVVAQEDAGKSKLPKTQVRLLQHSATAVYYSGGCPVLPDGSSDEHVISYISEKKKLSMPLMSFGSQIIDFVYTSKLGLCSHHRSVTIPLS